MSRRVCLWSGGNMKRLLLTLLVLHAVVQCTKADTGAPSHGDSKRKAQSTAQNNNNALAANDEQASGPNKEQKGNAEAGKSHQDQMAEQTNKNSATSSTSARSEASNAGSKPAAANGAPATPTETPKNYAALNLSCTESSNCTSYDGTECVEDPKDKKKLCFCGNYMLPRTASVCNETRRYVKFPCKNDAQCIENAECKLPDTAPVCSCKNDFSSTRDMSRCLHPLDLLNVEQEELRGKLEKLQEDYKNMDKRINGLKSSGTEIFPSLALTVLMAVSMLATF